MDKSNFQAFVDLAKHHKQMWVETTDGGDMPPTVIGIREGKPELMVIAPEIDKDLGLQAMNVMRRGMAIDQVIFLVDAHITLIKDKSPEETKRLFEKYSKPGSMQKACDEEGACALGEIADCLVVQYLDDNFRFHYGSYPYEYHGKDGGVEFRWLDDHKMENMDCEVDFTLVERSKAFIENQSEPKTEDKEIRRIGGYVVETMYRIMEQPTILEEEDESGFQSIANMAGLGQFLLPENHKKAMFHIGVSIRRLLNDEGYLTLECVNYNGSYSDFQAEMAEKYDIMCRSRDMVTEGKERLIEDLLDRTEKAAIASGDQEALETVRKARAELQQMKESQEE